MNRQLSLFGAGHAASECRRDAAIASEPKREPRKQQVLRLLSTAGYEGLTRYELAKIMGLESSAICSAVLELLAVEQVYELADRRANATGHTGCILILPCWLDGRPVS